MVGVRCSRWARGAPGENSQGTAGDGETIGACQKCPRGPDVVGHFFPPAAAERMRSPVQIGGALPNYSETAWLPIESLIVRSAG